MVSLDLKDRKILYELDLNARQSLSQIGRKVGLGKDVVSYRIKRMQEEGIIRNFWTAINTFKLGYIVFRMYLSFQYVSQKIKEEIIRKFVDYENTWAVVSTYRSDVDLSVVVWVNNIYRFYHFWEKILDDYEDYFERSSISIYTQAVSYKKSYLVPSTYDRSSRRMYVSTSGEKTVNIDEMDYRLLNEIALNAREPLIELAQKLGCTSQTINYRLKNLINKGIIHTFRVNIDLSKLELQKFKVEIYLKRHSQKRSIIKFLENKPYFECLNLVVGWADIEPEFVVKDVNELNQILEEIDSAFPNTIKKQVYWIVEEIHKERWLPKLY
jgi:Lrp/AsnC family leucine-responsive transcriptional regulator